MTEEAYVSFEVAKLLSKKGFDYPTLAYAYAENMIGHYSKPRVTDHTSIEAGRIPLPTLQMADRWLREKHNLSVKCELVANGFACSVSKLQKDLQGFIIGIEDCNVEIPIIETYDGAYDVAIKYCLENLIKED